MGTFLLVSSLSIGLLFIMYLLVGGKPSEAFKERPNAKDYYRNIKNRELYEARVALYGKEKAYEMTKRK